MKLSLNKTKEMIVHDFKVMPTFQSLKVEIVRIQGVSIVGVLSVNLQDNLSWSMHVKAIVKRMKQLTFAFRFLSFSFHSKI